MMSGTVKGWHMTNNPHLYGLILAGGGGTRLWPKSRKKTPKQFLKLLGEETMFQVTLKRFNEFIPGQNIIIVTTKRYASDIAKQAPDVPKQNIILEPDKRDTALAMLTGALYAMSLDPKAILVNGAADHLVANKKEFMRVMRVAAEVATDDKHLVAIGIAPTHPSTAFGYIKIGPELKHLGNGAPVFQVAKFTEKPNQSTARALIATGKYFWNANNYVWSAQALQASFKEHMPSLYQLTKDLPKLKPDKFMQALPAIYDQADTISIDYAISEKAKNLLLIPGDFGWNDIGEWQVVYDLGKKDPAGNVIIGNGQSGSKDIFYLDSQNNLVHTNNRLVALLGVNDMIIVDTDEILLVAPKSKSQDVKKIVEQLKKDQVEDYL